MMLSDVTGAEMYPTKEDLMYYRGVYDGMDPLDSTGEETDPRTYFRKVDYDYLAGEHLKACSSKRSELAGKKGVRFVFTMETKFDMEGARTPEEVEEQTELRDKLKGRFLSSM